MPSSFRSFMVAVTASAGLHGLFLLLAAWFIAVLPAVSRIMPMPLPEPPEPPPEPPVQEIAIAIIPEVAPPKPEEKPKPEPEKPEPPDKKDALASTQRPNGQRQFILPKENLPEQDPSRRNPAFFSSRNMRAASTAAPDPDGDPNRVSQEGYDLPMLSLNAIDFRDGLEDSTQPREARTDTVGPESPPEAPAPTTPPDVIADRPPESTTPAEPAATAAATPPAPPSPPAPPAESAAAREMEPAELTANPDAPAPPRQETPPPAPTIRDTPPEPEVRRAEIADRPPSPRRPREPAKPAPPPSLPAPQRRDPVNLSGKARVEQVRTKSRGAIAERGPEASVDAEATPEGRYAKIIHDRVGLVWNRKMSTIRGLTGVGTVEVEFDIDTQGRISNVQLVDPGKANPILEDVCLSSIIAAKLPPPPQEMLDEMRDPLVGGRIRRRFTFHRL